MTTRNQFLFSLFYLSFFLFVFSSVPLRAQDNTNIHPNGNSHPTVINKLGKISGKVLDQSNGYIMEYVNIIVIDAKTKNMLGGTITNAKGEFTIEELPYGSFIVKISYIGFSEFQSAVFTLTPKNPIFKLSPVSLVPNATTLAAVEVVGQKRVMEYTLDKKVINVEQNLVSDGGTAVDILQNVPAVSVDADGNVSMKGSSNITILIDGRPAELSGMGLDQLAASSIESIEIISNPSAKYNPEGMSGILNIKTKKRTFSGVNGMVSVSSSTANRHNASANINVGLGKVNLFTTLSGNYMDRKSKGNTETFSDILSSLYPNDNQQQEIGSKERNRKGLGGNIRLGADYRINARNTLTISVQAGSWRNDQFNYTPGTKTYSFNNTLAEPDYHLLQTLRNTSKSNSLFNQYNGTLAYKLSFPNPKQELTLDASFDYNTSDGNTRTERDIAKDSSDIVNSIQNSQTQGHRYNFDGQINYIHPFTDKLKLEVGYQGKIRSSFSADRQDLRIYKLQDTALDFNYVENIHGVYANFMAEIGKFSFQVGGRFEGANMYAYTISENKDTSFNYPYFRFYPAVHISYKIGKKQELQLSYSRRVNRPQARNLNPFIDYSNYPLSISFGNPNLIPEDIHSLELNYSLFFGKTSLYASVYYRFTDNIIRRYTDIDSEGMRITTSLNYDRGTNYGIDLTW
ncbi:MAG: TonB-dependent receptor, partial [Bacteroidales bacterium]